MDGVVLNEAACVVEGEEDIVDSHGHDVGVVLEGGASDEAADTAKTVYFNLGSHG